MTPDRDPPQIKVPDERAKVSVKKPKRRRLSRQQQRRRGLIRAGLTGFAILVLQPIANWPIVGRAFARLRPPGARVEADFLGACIKCGQCVQVCPVNAITFADLNEGFGSGVPFIDARKQACDFSCDALSCILACPTGALTHDIHSKEEVVSGTARLSRPDSCLARSGQGFHGTTRGPGFQGRLRNEAVDRWNAAPLSERSYEREVCDLCVIECPIGEDAIRLERLASSEIDGAMTPVVGDGCVGCGVCEMVCPEQPSCIVVDPFGVEPRV
jgi:ferredoxin-type protein NapG